MPQKLDATNKTKVLVADDDPAINDALAMMLEDAGYEVVTTLDAETVRQICPDYPDVVLLDIWMSGYNGGEICQELKKRQETKNIPIIMISANRDAEAIAKKSGADAFLAKPFEMDDLLETIRQHSASPR
jgi:DNA-binding response OmpR family regulator